jgi:hypothetical protein
MLASAQLKPVPLLAAAATEDAERRGTPRDAETHLGQNARQATAGSVRVKSSNRDPYPRCGRSGRGVHDGFADGK